MEFEKIKESFRQIYGKEITTEEFLQKLKVVKDDIDLLEDVAKVIREQVKNILSRMEKSIINKKSCNISKEERKIAIDLLVKLSKIVIHNEEQKKYIETLAKVMKESLDSR